MTGQTGQLRAALIGLLGFAAAREQMLLAMSPPGEQGTEERWAAAPLVAHNTEFKRQQAERLRAIRLRYQPAEFAEIDHASREVYLRYAAQPPDEVARDSNAAAWELIEGVRLAGDDDLLDPAGNPWLRGRQLWLQIVVRGFWHPAGHLIGYYLDHAQPDRAVSLAAQGVATAGEVGAPDQARGMASYNLACASSRAGELTQAAAALGEALMLNPELRVNAARDPDLAPLRDIAQ